MHLHASEDSELCYLPVYLDLVILSFCFSTPVLSVQAKLLAMPACYYICTIPITEATRKQLEPLATNNVNNNRFLFL